MGFHMERALFSPSPVSFSLRIKDSGERVEITGVPNRADWETRPGCWPVLHPLPSGPNGRQG